MSNFSKKTSNYVHLVSFSGSYRGASYQMLGLSVVVPTGKIKEPNTNSIAAWRVSCSLCKFDCKCL